jgi:hypothetical protein
MTIQQLTDGAWRLGLIRATDGPLSLKVALDGVGSRR